MTRCTYRDAQPVNAAAHTLAGLRVRIEQLRHRQACSRQPDNQPQLGSTGAGSEASVANRQHCEKCCAGVDSGAPMMEGGSIAIRRLTGSASQAPPHLVAQPLPALRPPQDAGCCPPLPPQRTAALPRRCHLDKVVAARLASSKSGGASQNPCSQNSQQNHTRCSSGTERCSAFRGVHIRSALWSAKQSVDHSTETEDPE